MHRNTAVRLLISLLILSIVCSSWPLLASAATPSSTANASATLAYTLRGLPIGRAVQNFYIGETYLYITQRADNVTYLSRLRIEGEEAYYMDQMVLNNWGHGEALDFYRYNGKEYFMVTTNGSDEYPKYYWSLQIARLEYEAGKTYTNYTGVKRFTNMKRATSDGSSLGGAYRVAACVNGDYTVFRIQVTSTKFVYSIYDTNKLNKLLDGSSPSLPSGDSTDYCLSMEDATSAYKYGITQEGSDRILPNNTFQGIEMSSLDSIYLAGGAEGDTPQIARMTYKGAYAKLVNITNVGTHEIEGLQTDRGKVYFLIVTSTNTEAKKDTQKIYYVNESVFGIQHSLVTVPGAKPTCTTEGMSDGATCSKCGQAQDVQERLAKIPHSIGKTEPSPANATDLLYFGFENAPEDQERYATNPAYGGVNYDKAGAMRTRNFYNGSGNLDFPANDTQSFVDGTVKTKLTGPYSTESSYAKAVSRRFIFGESNDTEASVGSLQYVPTNAEVLQLRFKLENLKLRGDMDASEQARSLTLRYYKNSDTTSVRNAYGYSGSYKNGEFMTVTIPLDSGFISADVITKLVVEFHGFVKSDDSKDAYVSLDYVYVGPKDKAPTQEEGYLYFSFDDSPSARYRYAGEVYGARNFDRLENWWYDTSNTNGVRMADGMVSFSPASGSAEEYCYVQSGTSLQYKPSAADYCQVRIQMEDAVSASDHPLGTFSLYFGVGNTDITDGNFESIDFGLTERVNGGFFVLTFPLNHANYSAAERINAIRMQFSNLRSAEGKIAKFRVDYLYIGPEAGLPIPQTCTEGGVQTYDCVTCGKADATQEVLPSLAHNFVNGVCVCGKTEYQEPIEDTALTLRHSLNLAGDISVNLVLPKTALEGYDMETVYVESVMEHYSGNVQAEPTTLRITPVENGNYYYFTVAGLTAVRMNDRIRSVFYGVKDGQLRVSPVDDYAISDYAYAMLNQSSDSKMLTLCADLLRYGAEAQSYKKYRTDALVDAAMTDVHRGYLSNTDALTFTATDSYLGDLASPTITWVGKTLDLGSKVGLKFVFNTQNYSGDIANLSMKVSYKGSNGEIKTVTLTGAEAYGSSGSYYSFTFYGLLASELRTVIDVAIFDGETQLAETIRYSAESYASKAMSGDLAPLCKALFAYSDSAKAYFTK